jgi:UDP-3-O-[3-hydroxymyristoyl] glucosamine N-acyltransferase
VPEITVGELAKLLDGQLDGDADGLIDSVASIDQAGPFAATFAQDSHVLCVHKELNAGAVIGPMDSPRLSCPVIRVRQPRLAWNQVLKFFAPAVSLPQGIDPNSWVSPEAKLAPDVRIGPFVVVSPGAQIGAGTVLYPGTYIGQRARVGENCLLYPNVVVREDVEIADRVIIGPGTVVGSDGFGFVTSGGKHWKVPQIGKVIIEDDVEVGANVTVDRPMMGATIIHRGTKTDNLVQIAHNVEIGEDCLLVALVGIAGSTTLGNNVTMAGQSGAAGHQTIGAGSVVMARGLVVGDLPAGSQVSGAPARPHNVELRARAASLHLPQELKKLKQLEKRVAQLEAALDEVK